MNNIKLPGYKVLYDKGAFFLRTKTQWIDLYAVATPLNKITRWHLFQIHFSESAYNYGYRKTPNKEIYKTELTSVSGSKTWSLSILEG